MKKTFLVSILSILFLSFNPMQEDVVKQITSLEAANMIENDEKIVVLDVRLPMEYRAGHIKNAINIDIWNKNAFSRIDSLDHSATYIVHCQTNVRSKKAADYMNENGFKNIYLLSDGFAGWNRNGLPEEK